MKFISCHLLLLDLELILDHDHGLSYLKNCLGKDCLVDHWNFQKFEWGFFLQVLHQDLKISKSTGIQLWFECPSGNRIRCTLHALLNLNCVVTSTKELKSEDSWIKTRKTRLKSFFATRRRLSLYSVQKSPKMSQITIIDSNVVFWRIFYRIPKFFKISSNCLG